MSGPDGVARPVHAAVVPAIGVVAQGHPAHDELVAAVAALLAVTRGAGAGGAGAGRAAATAGPVPADWRRHRLAALGLAPRRRP